MIVDMRLRPPIPEWTDKAQFRKGVEFYPTRVGFPRPPSAEERSIPLLLQEMDEAGIRWGVVMGRQSAEPMGVIPNDAIARFVTEHSDRFVAFVLHADPDDAVAELHALAAAYARREKSRRSHSSTLHTMHFTTFYK